MRQLNSLLVAAGLFAVAGCTQPAPVKTTKSGPAVASTVVAPTATVNAPSKPADSTPSKPAEKVPEKPADKTPPPPPK